MSVEDEVSNEIETTSEEVETTENDDAVVPEAAGEGAETPEAAVEEEPAEETEGEPGEEGEVAGFKPNTKFKVLDKEMEIPKEFQSLMKDPDSEKMVRELFEKANGLDGVKTKLNEIRSERNTLAQESQGLKSSIGKVRGIYQSAVQTGNWHKMDDFFEHLSIPQEHIMKYAIAKAQLAEMDPSQRQMVESRLMAERQAEMANESAGSLQNEMFQQSVDLKRLQFETTLARPDVQSMAESLDQKFGKTGLFEQEVIAAGESAWHNEKKNLSVQEAVSRVVKKYGLEAGTVAGDTPNLPRGNSQLGAKKVIQRNAGTIPNINGSSSSSPLRSSNPRSIEDLKKLSEKANRGERV